MKDKGEEEVLQTGGIIRLQEAVHPIDKTGTIGLHNQTLAMAMVRIIVVRPARIPFQMIKDKDREISVETEHTTLDHKLSRIHQPLHTIATTLLTKSTGHGMIFEVLPLPNQKMLLSESQVSKMPS